MIFNWNRVNFLKNSTYISILISYDRTLFIQFIFIFLIKCVYLSEELGLETVLDLKLENKNVCHKNEEYQTWYVSL